MCGDDNKQNELEEALNRYSLELVSDFTDDIQFFKNLYSEEAKFRHSYSSLTALLLRLSSENKDAIEIITQNLNSLIDQINESDEDPDSYFMIKMSKLVDPKNVKQSKPIGILIDRLIF